MVKLTNFTRSLVLTPKSSNVFTLHSPITFLNVHPITVFWVDQEEKCRLPGSFHSWIWRLLFPLSVLNITRSLQAQDWYPEEHWLFDHTMTGSGTDNNYTPQGHYSTRIARSMRVVVMEIGKTTGQHSEVIKISWVR